MIARKQLVTPEGDPEVQTGIATEVMRRQANGSRLCLIYLLEASRAFMIDVNRGCPGNFQQALEAVSFRPLELWDRNGINLVRLAVIATWLGFFSSFAFLLASFLVHHGRHGRIGVTPPPAMKK